MSVALKLFTGPDAQTGTQAGGKPPQLWTLREAFEDRILPMLQRLERTSSTIRKWYLAIEYWEQLHPDNMPISRITDNDLTQFCDQLISTIPEIDTNTTANQKMMHVRSILRKVPEAFRMGIPVGTPLPEQAATRHRRVIKDQLLNTTYHHCDVATLSRDPHLPAPVIWRALLSLFVAIGCRRGEGCMMPRTAWRRDPDFPEFPEHPDFEVEGESAHGWLVFHTPKTRARKKGLPLVLPVPAMLARHLDELDQYSPRRERMFPIGDHPTSWQGQLDRIQWGVKTTRRNKDVITDTFCFQDLRKTVSRRYRKHAGRDVALYFLGQQPRGINAKYYDDLTEDAIEAVNTMGWPAAFLPSKENDRQLKLF